MKVSVIIPIRKNRFNERMIDSLRKQSLKEIEIIGVYDVEKSEEFEAMHYMDSRFFSVDGNGKGAGAARNIGLKYAKGKYVVFFDSDDFFDNDILLNAYTLMEDENLDVCVWNVAEYDNVSKEINYDNPHFRKELLPNKKTFSAEEHDYLFNFTSGAPWNKMFRHQFIEDNKLSFMETERFNDLFFSFVALEKAKRISSLDFVGTFYRVNNHESLQSTREKTLSNAIEVFEAIYKQLISDMHWEGKIKKSFLNYLLSCSLTIMENCREYTGFFDMFNYVKSSKVLEQLAEDEVFPFYKGLYDKYLMIKEKNISEFLFCEGRRIEYVNVPAKIDEKDIYPQDYYVYMKSDYRLREIENSFTYKLGCFLTFIPRKVISFLKNER